MPEKISLLHWLCQKVEDYENFNQTVLYKDLAPIRARYLKYENFQQITLHSQPKRHSLVVVIRISLNTFPLGEVLLSHELPSLRCVEYATSDSIWDSKSSQIGYFFFLSQLTRKMGYPNTKKTKRRRAHWEKSLTKEQRAPMLGGKEAELYIEKSDVYLKNLNWVLLST